MALTTQEFSAEEQVQFDAMRAADSAPIASGEETAAPVPAQPASDTTTADAAAADAPPAPKNDTVPLKTFLEERRKLEERIDQERKSRQTLEERTNILLQRFGQPQPPAPAEAEIPPLDRDPMGHILATVERQNTTAQQNAQTIQQVTAALQQQEAERQLVGWAQTKESEFKIENPDYDGAVTHLKQVRDAQLQAFGVSDPFVRQQQIAREGMQIALAAHQRNANPAEMMMELARASGYQPKATPGPDATAATDAAERLRTAQAGQEQARSLGAVRGSAPPPLNAQRLLEMSDKEFDKMVGTPEGKALLGS